MGYVLVTLGVLMGLAALLIGPEGAQILTAVKLEIAHALSVLDS